MKKYTIYTTYILENVPDQGYVSGVIRNTTPLHCNYIQHIDTDSFGNDEVNLYFTTPEDFKFLNIIENSVSSGLGFSANKISMLVQIVYNTEVEPDVYTRNKPLSTEWRVIDVTQDLMVYDNNEDIIPHTIGQQIKPESFELSSFKFSLSLYSGADKYDLSYINYPKQTDFDNLCFGDEEFFFGNVRSDIEATINTTNITVTLPSDEFNTTTNETWDGNSDIQISEIGIYDNDNNLVAIGKLNNPISKNSNTERTINFAIDF